jgi:hypothetical protein
MCAGQPLSLPRLDTREETMDITFQFAVYRDTKDAPILPL